MNKSIDSTTDRSSKRTLAIIYATAILMYVPLFLVPGIYFIKYTPPETNNLRTTKGIFGIERKNRGSSFYTITNQQGTIFLKCNGSFIAISRCEKTHKLNKFHGKIVEIYWDKRNVYPLLTQNHFFGLSNNGVVVTDPKIERERISSSKKKEKWILLAMAAFCLSIITYSTNKYSRRRK